MNMSVDKTLNPKPFVAQKTKGINKVIIKYSKHLHLYTKEGFCYRVV